MTDTAAKVVEPAPQLTVQEAPSSVRRRRLPHWGDATVAIAYIALAAFVMGPQWRNLDKAYLVNGGQDQTMWEWFFAFTAHAVSHFQSPLGTDLQNHPLGVNLMANTAMFGVSVPFAPVTLLFGATVTFVAALTAGLCGTAYAWYWLFRRELVESRFAAAIGGLFCGFAPAMVSHANGHPNFVVLFLLPLIAAQILRLTRSARWIRDGVVLGLLLALQIGFGEEPLLIFAIAFGLFALVYYARDPKAGLEAWRAVWRPLCLGGAIALSITGFALWWQFFGPQSYRHIDHGQMGNDLLAITQFPTQSFGGDLAPGQSVAINITEQNAYFGWPLLAVVAIAGVWLWRNKIARAATITAAVMIVVSLGAELKIGKDATGIELPWEWLGRVPLLESVLETRFAIAAIPAIAIVLILATERALRSSTVSTPWFAGLALALIPLTPTPLPVVDRSPTPEFFSAGSWREFTCGGSVVVVPLPGPVDARALRWQQAADFQFPIAGGYFVGPVGSEREGKYGPEDRSTALVLAKAQSSGQVPQLDAATRAAVFDDLRFWQADVVVLPQTNKRDVLKTTVDRLIGFPGRQVDDAWVWDVAHCGH